MHITLFKNKWMEIKANGTWVYASRPNGIKAAVVIATTVDGEFVLIQNFRKTVDNEVLEFSAGLMDEGETPEQTAVRELLEETGYAGEVVKSYPECMVNAGGSDEKMTIVRIKNCVKVAEQDLDGDEEIRVVLVEKESLTKYIDECVKVGIDVSSRLIAYSVDR